MDHSNRSDKYFNSIVNMDDRYLTRLFIGLISFLLLSILLIWIIDPYGVSPIKIRMNGVNRYKPKRIDIDRLIKPYEVWLYQPNTIFLGTSRIQQSIDPSLMKGTEYYPAYNASIPAMNLASNAEYIKKIIKIDSNLKHVFLELFIFNFLGQGQEIEEFSWLKYLGEFLSLNLSMDSLFASVQTVIDNISIMKKYAPTPHRIASLGYRLYPNNFNPKDTFGDGRQFARTVIQMSESNKYSISSSALESLNKIVDLCKKNNIQLHLIMTPDYPWWDTQFMMLGYWSIIEKWIATMSHYPNVMSFSQYNNLTGEPVNTEPKMHYWNDPTHFGVEMGRSMLKAYLGIQDKAMPSNFMRALNEETLKLVLKERRQGVLDWMQNNLGFVKIFKEEEKNIRRSKMGASI